MKKCVDCRWFEKQTSERHFSNYECGRRITVKDEAAKAENKHRERIGLPLIAVSKTSSIRPNITSCYINRRDGWLSSIMNKTCGKRARYFQPKEPINQLIDHVDRNGVMNK